MIASGFTKRSISDQTGVFGYNINVTLDNTSGYCQIGFSGTQNVAFTFQNGRIYGPQNLFVGAYQANVPIAIQGQVGPTSYDYSIDGAPIALGNPIQSGTYSWIFINPSGTTPSFDVSVQGQIPAYSIPSSGTYQGIGTIITGMIVNLNPEVKFRIFNAALTAISPYSLTGFTTGDITGTGYFYLTSNYTTTSTVSIPISFYTNFGEVDISYQISGYTPIYPNVYLTLSPLLTGSNVIPIPNGYNQAFTAYLSNYPNSAQISVSLNYISGVTGNIYQYVSISNPVTGEVSGYVYGAQTITNYYQSTVTGTDPITMLPVSGTGIGYLTSSIIAATGYVLQNFTVEASGYGSGSYLANLAASGMSSGIVSGTVGILGALSIPVNVFNIPATGNSPFFYTGIMQSGVGQVYLQPTGYFHVTNPITYSGEYISGNIQVLQTFEGWLYHNYSVISVGYATGDLISGIVDSEFGLNFEPGYYVFSKYFYGVITGNCVNVEGFNPSVCQQSGTAGSGLFSGLFWWPPDANTPGSSGSSGTALGCAGGAGGGGGGAGSGLPSIFFTGIPIALYDSNGNIVPDNQAVLIVPPEGFLPSENSDTVLASGWTRTTTSRMGATISGTGYFDQIIQECGFNGVWRENLSTYPYPIENDSHNTHYSRISADIDLLNSGAATTAQMSFRVTGNNNKTVVLRAINNFNGTSGTYSGLTSEGLSSGIINAIFPTISLFRVASNQNILIANNSSWINAPVSSISIISGFGLAPSSPYDSAIGIILGTGEYLLETYYSANTQENYANVSSFVEFSYPNYAGYKSAGTIPIYIQRVGNDESQIDGYVTFTSQGTNMAISGVDFVSTPISFTIAEGGYFTSVNVPVLDNAYCGVPAQFQANLYGYYDGFGQFPIIGGNSTAIITICNDSCGPEYATGICLSQQPPEPPFGFTGPDGKFYKYLVLLDWDACLQHGHSYLADSITCDGAQYKSYPWAAQDINPGNVVDGSTVWAILTGSDGNPVSGDDGGWQAICVNADGNFVHSSDNTPGINYIGYSGNTANSLYSASDFNTVGATIVYPTGGGVYAITTQVGTCVDSLTLTTPSVILCNSYSYP